MCIWWQTGRIRPKDGLLTIPFFLLSLAAGVTTVWFQWNRGIAGESIPIGDYFERFEAAGYALWFYVAKDLVPVHLSVIYPRWEDRKQCGTHLDDVGHRHANVVGHEHL